jgi:Protein of unknown function (DUF3604)
MALRLAGIAPLLALAAALPACSRHSEAPAAPASTAAEAPQHPDGPPHARWDVVDMLRTAETQRYAPSDGGGRAWLERAPGQRPYALSATPDRFTIVYEVGPAGIASGGSIFFQVSPFWDWSTPQVVNPEARGYTKVTASAPDIELTSETVDRQLLRIAVTGRALKAGERITIVYGAGMAGAMPDRYAERRSPFWIGVDGDGDGTRRFLVDSPTIDVHPGPAAALLATLPTIARPGEKVRLTLAFIDAWRNSGMPVEADVVFPDPPDGLELPKSVHFAPEDHGRRSIEVVARKTGTWRVHAVADPLDATTNPLVVTESGPRVLWGDLHGHSNFSDGTGLPEDYFIYARDVSGLDVSALTDHDHWGILPLAEHPEMWQEIVRQTRRFNEPGRFVTILGYEWTNWIYGHRHVLFFDEDEGHVFDSVDPEYDSPAKLWKALEGRKVLTVAHHTAGGPMPTDWDIPPDPRFEPVTEIVSIHGSSEAMDSPCPVGEPTTSDAAKETNRSREVGCVIHSPVPGNFVRDALERGYRLGFIGSGDRHDGHPGAYQIDPPQGGLAAILAEERTRDAVLAALRARRVYATNGPRILLRVALGGYGMGQSVPVPEGGKLSDQLFVHVVAQTPLDRVELVRSGKLVDGILTEGRLDVTLTREVEDLAPGEYLYVRAVQRDGGIAWSSPIYIGADPS